MKIAHIITTINRGGAENQLVQMIIEQKKKEENISLIYLKGDGYWREVLVKNKIRCFGPIFPNGNYLSINRLISLLKILLKKKYEILHLHMPPALFVMYIIKNFFIKYYPLIIFTSHNDESFLKFKLLDKYITPKILSYVDHIVSISLAVKSFLINKYNINSSKISIIEYGFKKNFYNQNLINNEELSYFNPNDIYIGTVARLVPQKRIDLLIESFSKVDAKYFENLKLVIVGKGILENQLKRLSNEKGVFDNIIWINYTENVIAHMKKWDLFCLTSEYEGFGLVLLEAISAGLPILAMDKSSIKKIIGPCGEVVKFGDCLTFSEKIVEILKNKNKYLNKNHLKNFDFKRNILKHSLIYKKKIN